MDRKLEEYAYLLETQRSVFFLIFNGNIYLSF